MAMTGGTAHCVRSVKTNYGNNSWTVDLYVYVKEESQSVANNQTILSLGMYAVTPSGYDIGSWNDEGDKSYLGTATSGDNCKTFAGDIPNFSGTRWIVENKKVTVDHNADGTKTVPIYWKWNVNSPWGQCVYPSGSFNYTITTIPRASSISSMSDVTLGKNSTIKFTPASKSFWYAVQFILGDESKWVTYGLNPGSTSEYTATIYSSMVGYSPFAEQLTGNPPSGKLTVKLHTFKDKSLSNDAFIGTSTKTVNITVPENSDTKPDAPTVALTPVNSIGGAFASLYIQGLSKVKAVISAPTKGKYDATISSYATSVAGKSKSGKDTTSDYLASSGNVNVISTVKDSRGFSNTTTKQITVLPYSAPSVIPYGSEKMVVCERCTEDGTPSASGTYLRIKAGRSYYKIESGGKQNNFCLLRYRYKTSSADEYSAWETLIDKTSASDSVDVILGDIVTSITTSYDVQINAVDDVGKSHTLSLTVPTDKVNFHEREGGDGAAFGKYSEKPKSLEVAEDWEIMVYGDRWKRLGYSSSVSPSTETGYGTAPDNDAVYWRVENGNHVYIAFNCACTYPGGQVLVNADLIPEEYRPKRDAYAMVATAGRNIARVYVAPTGKVYIEYVQLITTTDKTMSAEVTWIDGYIDYFISP